MMNNFWWTLIEIGALQLLLICVYFLIRDKISDGLKRKTLLILPGLPILIMSVRLFLMNEGVVYSTASIQLTEVVVGVNNESSNVFIWEYLYWMGVLVFGIWSILKIMKLIFFFRKAVPFIEDPKIKILSSELKDSFSFFNRIHLSAHLNEDEKIVVLDHELIHAKKGHSFDLLLMELYHSFFWYNPVMFVVKKELIQVHEFEVDGEMYKKYNLDYLSHLISYALGATSAHLLLTSQFYNRLTLTKRINKMKNKTKKNNAFLLTIPILAAGLTFISWVAPKEQNAELVPAEIVLVDGELDKKPEFKGGKEAMFKYMGEHIKYPKEAQKNDISGVVYVKFVVGTDGKISNAKIQKGAHKLLDDEALRVVNGMPDWNPGIKNGKKVKAEMTLPINFQF